MLLALLQKTLMKEVINSFSLFFPLFKQSARAGGSPDGGAPRSALQKSRFGKKRPGHKENQPSVGRCTGGPPRILRLTPERDSKCCWFVAAGRKACLVDHETTTGPLQKNERRSGKKLTVARIRGVALRTIDPNGPAAPNRPERARGAASRKAKKKDPKMASAIEKALKRL